MKKNVYIDLTGKRFGRLLVLEKVGSDPGGAALWLCRCDCGIETIVKSSSLRSGQTKSCGCLRREVSPRNQKIGTLITFDGETRNIAQWARELKMSCSTLRVRLQKGWSVERALTTPTKTQMIRSRWEEMRK
jgi:hypothetical protein